MTIVVSAVILAAGVGQRMKTECPKQYLGIGKKTILEHSVKTLLTDKRIANIIIVVNPNSFHFFNSTSLGNHPKVTIIKGGKERANSALCGVQAADKAQWVLVHDAARPCIHQSDLSRLLDLTKTSKIGGILAAPVRDTIKRANPGKRNIAYTVDRVNLWHAFTPQFFPRELLYKCLLRALKEGAFITDEASALEYCGFYPELIEGRIDNIKVTYPEDIQLAELYINHLDYLE